MDNSGPVKMQSVSVPTQQIMKEMKGSMILFDRSIDGMSLFARDKVCPNVEFVDFSTQVNRNQNSEGLRHPDLTTIEFDFGKIPNSTFGDCCMCTDCAWCTVVRSLCAIDTDCVVALWE